MWSVIGGEQGGETRMERDWQYIECDREDKRVEGIVESTRKATPPPLDPNLSDR